MQDPVSQEETHQLLHTSTKQDDRAFTKLNY